MNYIIYRSGNCENLKINNNTEVNSGILLFEI